MDNNYLLTLLIAFVLGCFAHQMMKQMCGERLFEGIADSTGFVPGCDNKWCCGSAHGWSSQGGYCAYCTRDPNDNTMCIE